MWLSHFQANVFCSSPAQSEKTNPYHNSVLVSWAKLIGGLSPWEKTSHINKTGLDSVFDIATHTL